MAKPVVSVVMPCYNGEAFLAAAVDSVLGQTFRDFELIVIDDGSTDRSADILTGYGERIHVIRQGNRGVSAARNAGIGAARGDFIAFLDADDWWEPDFLAEMVAAMADPRTAIAYCGWQNVGVGAGKPFVPPDYEGPDKMHHLLRFASLWPIHAILIRRSTMPPGMPFNPEYPACEDYDLWLRIASFHRIQLVPRVLAYYRKHGETNATTNQARVARYNLLVKQRFLADFPRVAQRIPRTKRRAYLAGGVIDRGYRCLWGGDLKNAHGIFRHALFHGLVGQADVRYAIAALLPFSAFAWAATLGARRSRGRR
jgi:glycosyltransferase involved in cell wall biosynthesis